MDKNTTTFGKKHTFLRDNYAVNFQAVTARNGYQTVNVEIAPAFSQRADWSKKISLQLSEKDMFSCFYKTSHKKLLKYESKYHGDNNNKSISFEETLDGCNITLRNAGKTMYFLCSFGEWFYGKKLILEQLLNHPLCFSEAERIMPDDSW